MAEVIASCQWCRSGVFEDEPHYRTDEPIAFHWHADCYDALRHRLDSAERVDPEASTDG